MLPLLFAYVASTKYFYDKIKYFVLCSCYLHINLNSKLKKGSDKRSPWWYEAGLRFCAVCHFTKLCFASNWGRTGSALGDRRANALGAAHSRESQVCLHWMGLRSSLVGPFDFGEIDIGGTTLHLPTVQWQRMMSGDNPVCVLHTGLSVSLAASLAGGELIRALSM